MRKQPMTDEILGQIAKQQWELNKQLLEGTHDPAFILQSLQQITEGRSRALTIETWPMTFSQKVYDVKVEPERNLYDLAKESGIITDVGGDIKKYNPPGRTIPGRNAKVGLVEIVRGTAFGVASIFIKEEGYELADAWEMMAFAKTASWMRITGRDCRIFCLGSTGDYWLGGDHHQPGEKGHICFMAYRHGWRASVYKIGANYELNNGDHVLLRQKTKQK